MSATFSTAARSTDAAAVEPPADEAAASIEQAPRPSTKTAEKAAVKDEAAVEDFLTTVPFLAETDMTNWSRCCASD